jgi:disulfide bond formation protein DsbB
MPLLRLILLIQSVLSTLLGIYHDQLRLWKDEVDTYLCEFQIRDPFKPSVKQCYLLNLKAVDTIRA